MSTPTHDPNGLPPFRDYTERLDRGNPEPTTELRDLTLIVVSDPVWQHVTRMDGTQLAAALYAAGVRPPA